MAHNPLGPLTVFATNDEYCDPALDAADRAAMARYRETRAPGDAPLRPGVEPVGFVLTPIRPIVRAMVLSKMDAETRNACAFLASCHEIRLPGGRELKPRSVTRGAHGSQIAPDDWVDEVAAEFGLETVMEIGRVAWQRADLPKAGGRSYWYPGG